MSEHPAKIEKLRNIKETADFLGVSQVTIHRMIKRKDIGFYRIGNRILFSMEAHLLPFLERNESKPK